MFTNNDLSTPHITSHQILVIIIQSNKMQDTKELLHSCTSKELNNQFTLFRYLQNYRRGVQLFNLSQIKKNSTISTITPTQKKQTDQPNTTINNPEQSPNSAELKDYKIRKISQKSNKFMGKVYLQRNKNHETFDEENFKGFEKQQKKERYQKEEKSKIFQDASIQKQKSKNIGKIEVKEQKSQISFRTKTFENERSKEKEYFGKDEGDNDRKWVIDEYKRSLKIKRVYGKNDIKGVVFRCRKKTKR